MIDDERVKRLTMASRQYGQANWRMVFVYPQPATAAKAVAAPT